MFEKEHLEFVNKLLKQGGAGAAEKQEIFKLYKTYIDPMHLNWTDSSCASCSSSILRMWDKVKEYVTKNSHLFTK
jgi:hypothetical protein